MSPFSHGEPHGGSDPTCGSDGGALRWLAGEAGPSDASSRWRVADTPAAAGKMLLAAVCALATLALTESIVLFAAALALPAFFSVSYGPALTESLENLETLAVWCGRDEDGAVWSKLAERAPLPSPNPMATRFMGSTAIVSIFGMLSIAVLHILAVSGVDRAALCWSSAVHPLSYSHDGCEPSSELPSRTSGHTLTRRHGGSLSNHFWESKSVTWVCLNFSLVEQRFACALGRLFRLWHYALAFGRVPSSPSSSPLFIIVHTYYYYPGTLARAMMRHLISAECSPGSVRNRARGIGA